MSPGAEEPGKQSCGGGAGEGLRSPPTPPTPAATTHSCTAKKPFDLHPVAGGVNGKDSQEMIPIVGKS